MDPAVALVASVAAPLPPEPLLCDPRRASTGLDAFPQPALHICVKARLRW